MNFQECSFHSIVQEALFPLSRMLAFDSLKLKSFRKHTEMSTFLLQWIFA